MGKDVFELSEFLKNRPENMTSAEYAASIMAELQHARQKATELEAKVEELSVSPISGLPGEHKLRERLDRAQDQDGSITYTVIHVDADYLKEKNEFNDRFANGIIRNIGEICATYAKREEDKVYKTEAFNRYGDTFVIILENCEIGHAKNVAKNIQDDLAKKDWESSMDDFERERLVEYREAHPGKPVITVTCGIAQDPDLEKAIDKANDLTNLKKTRGRNGIYTSRII